MLLYQYYFDQSYVAFMHMLSLYPYYSASFKPIAWKLEKE